MSFKNNNGLAFWGRAFVAYQSHFHKAHSTRGLERFHYSLIQFFAPLRRMENVMLVFRYKAWAPYSALHPTISVNTPLVFDIYDTWNNRCIRGCTYYVSHPGGRSYDTFPINSLEAESRRTTRFWEFNHTPKQVAKVKNQATESAPVKSYVVVNTDIKENIE